ncbi:membrane protein [Microbacterium phage Zooman]|nr:membrane protein [Microbacterium phage Zooman]
MIALMFILTLVIIFAMIMQLIRAMKDGGTGHWIGFAFTAVCAFIAMWYTLTTFMGLDPLIFFR